MDTARMQSRAAFVAAALVFALGLLLFTIRGPLRAVQGNGSGDLATVYSAARSWINGSNPYDHVILAEEFLQSAGGSPGITPSVESRPSVYFVTAMPVVAIIAWLPWSDARIVWCLISLASFAVFLWFLLGDLAESPEQRLLLGGAILFFSPTHTGVAAGNPAVLACSLIALSIHFANVGRSKLSGLVFGIALCLKPQLAICALAVLVLCRAWQSILVGVLTVSFNFLIAVLRNAPAAGLWLRSQAHNINVSLAPGGINDPSVTNTTSYHLINLQAIIGVFVRDTHLNNLLVWFVIGSLAIGYIALRMFVRSEWSWQEDLAVLAPLTIAITYHRYYDAQLLLLMVPILLKTWRNQERTTSVLLFVCLALLAFPSQTILMRYFPSQGTGNTNLETLKVLILFRHQPMAVAGAILIVCSHLSLAWYRERSAVLGPTFTVSVS